MEEEGFCVGMEEEGPGVAVAPVMGRSNFLFFFFFFFFLT
jgi:hypothetical protein